MPAKPSVVEDRRTYTVVMVCDLTLRKRIATHCNDNFPLTNSGFLKQLVTEFFERQETAAVLGQKKVKKKPEPAESAESAA
jgi:hypothetical protein